MIVCHGSYNMLFVFAVCQTGWDLWIVLDRPNGVSLLPYSVTYTGSIVTVENLYVMMQDQRDL